MVFFAPLVGAAAIFAGFAAAIPMPDSSIGNEVAVSAPNGTPMSDTASMPQATGSSNYGSSGSGSSYGGSGSSYGGSGSSYGGGSGDMSMESSSMMSDKSTMMKDKSTMMNDKSTMMMETSSAMATSTASSYGSYSTPSYGSGNWGGSGYDSCVQQCVASYGSMGSYMPTATASMGSSGSGATHTVIVAPTQGVLRYVPFAVNASVGDTVMFMWGANNHTVTKSSQLELCNKTSDALFASGTHDKGFTFTQVVNDTNPTFFYCATPGHCPKGMFGIINPPNAAGSPTAVSSMMPSMMNDSTMAAMGSYTNMQTANSTAAASWGSNMDMSALPSWAQASMAENVMYTRTFLASNPDVMGSDGSVNLGNAGSNPLMIPMDVTAAVNNAASGSSSTASSSASATSSTAASTGTAAPAAAAKSPNGARSLSSSSALAGVVVIIATFLAL